MYSEYVPNTDSTKFADEISQLDHIAGGGVCGSYYMLLDYSLATFSSRKTIIYAHVENQSPTPQVMFLRFTALGSFRGLARGRRDLHLHRQF